MTSEANKVPEFKALSYSVEDKIARIVLKRPERHNALDFDLCRELLTAFEQVSADNDAHVVILSGEGKSFCSGFDSESSPYLTPPDEGWTLANVQTRLGDIEKLYKTVWNCPKPTIAQIHGICIAAGCYLQLLCDMSVAADDAKLGHGLMKYHGGVSSMPLWQVLLGPRVARYLLMSSRVISGSEAATLGLVTMSVPKDALDETVETLAKDCITGDLAGVRIGKESLNADLEMMGVGAMFRTHSQLNAMLRFVF